MFEQPKTAVREIGPEIEPFDRVVEVERVDPDVVSGSVWLDELSDRVVVRFECIPRHRILDLYLEIEREISRRGGEGRHQERDYRQRSSKPSREIAGRQEEEDLQSLSDQKVDGRYRSDR